MNQETSPVLLEHYLIRTIMSLSVAAVKTDLDDIRDDLRDAAALLIRLAMANPVDIAVRDWCDRTLGLLETMDKFDEPTISSARLAVLRLRSILLAATSDKNATGAASEITEAKIVRPRLGSLGDNPKKIVEFVKANPDVRTRELVTNFLSMMSERTIKRCLKELVECGMLEHLRREGAVLYRVRSGGQS